MVEKEVKDMATEILLRYLQYWGQTAKERSEVLNKAVKFVGIKATFVQQGSMTGWEYQVLSEGKKAKEFRHDLEKCWPIGSWEEEHSAICNVLIKYKNMQEIDHE